MINRCIILGSGASLKEGISLGLSFYLEREVTFGINDAVKFFDCTAFTFGDWAAYASRYDLYKQHPLVIGRYDTHFTHKIEGSIPCPKQENLILLPGSGKYNGAEGLSKGLYSSVLTGAFTLNLAIRLGFNQIFLLGFDCGSTPTNNTTHFYEGIPEAGVYCDYSGQKTTGVGKDEQGNYNTSFYNNSDDSINALWNPFQKEAVMIYNVSLESRIEVFQKIGYQTMITILNQNRIKVNQTNAQAEIRAMLTPYNKA